MFGTLVALVVFGRQWPRAASSLIKVSAATDNKGNACILPKLMTTKFPLVVILAEIAEQLRINRWSLDLEWTPREQNMEADALTNQDFAAFNVDNQLKINVSELNWEVLPQMLDMAEDIFQRVQAKRVAAKIRKAGDELVSPEARQGSGRRRRLKERAPWV